MVDIVGWISASLLMATLLAQITRQWKERTTRGVSIWLFWGQLASSIGFIVYSVLVHNTVFIITNSLIAMVAILGEYTYYRNRHLGGNSSRKTGQKTGV